MTKFPKTKGSWVFVLILLGTLGLLANELAFHWGRTATLLFAALNAVGLAVLGPVLWGARRGQEK